MCPWFYILYLQRSIHATFGDDKYSSARKEVLTHMCSRPMQVRAQNRPQKIGFVRLECLSRVFFLLFSSRIPDGTLFLYRCFQQGKQF